MKQFLDLLTICVIACMAGVVVAMGAIKQTIIIFIQALWVVLRGFGQGVHKFWKKIVAVIAAIGMVAIGMIMWRISQTRTPLIAHPSTPNPMVKMYLIWGAFIVGVVILGWLTWRIALDQQKKNSKVVTTTEASPKKTGNFFDAVQGMSFLAFLFIYAGWLLGTVMNLRPDFRWPAYAGILSFVVLIPSFIFSQEKLKIFREMVVTVVVLGVCLAVPLFVHFGLHFNWVNFNPMIPSDWITGHR